MVQCWYVHSSVYQTLHCTVHMYQLTFGHSVCICACLCIAVFVVDMNSHRFADSSNPKMHHLCQTCYPPYVSPMCHLHAVYLPVCSPTYHRNRDYHQRPSFMELLRQISGLGEDQEQLKVPRDSLRDVQDPKRASRLGSPLIAAEQMYKELQYS